MYPLTIAHIVTQVLILILIFIILYPLLKIIFSVWSQVRTFKKQFNEQQESGGQSGDPSANSRKRNGRGNRKGRLSQVKSQYVEFEEIKDTDVSSNSSHESGTSEAGGGVSRKDTGNKADTSVRIEPQISDAEFEEL